MSFLTQFKILDYKSISKLTCLIIISLTTTMTISCDNNEEEVIADEEIVATTLPLSETSITSKPTLAPISTLTPIPKPTSSPTSTPVATLTPIPKPTSTPSPISIPKSSPEAILDLIDVIKIMNLESNQNYSVFSNYLKNSELENEISTRDQVTLFLPSNSALEILKIYLNENDINSVLEMHILPFKFREKDLKKFSHLDTFLHVDT